MQVISPLMPWRQEPLLVGFCEGNSPLTGEFPAQRASNAENASIWWRYHEKDVAVEIRGTQARSYALVETQHKP